MLIIMAMCKTNGLKIIVLLNIVFTRVGAVNEGDNSFPDKDQREDTAAQ